MLAPVVIFTYSRLSHLKLTVESLLNNRCATETDVFFVSDAPRTIEEQLKVDVLREYISTISGFRSVNKIFRKKNLGPFLSPSTAETEIISDYGKVISLEDDNVTSPVFLEFMNNCLSYYESSNQIVSITGYCLPVTPHGTPFGTWISPWHCPWTYATWKSKRSHFDYHRQVGLRRLVLNGSLRTFRYNPYLLNTYARDLKNKIIAADARICTQMVIDKTFSVAPTHSLVDNIGCDGSGLHSGTTDKFRSVIYDGDINQMQYVAPTFDPKNSVLRAANRFLNGNAISKTRSVLSCIRTLVNN